MCATYHVFPKRKWFSSFEKLNGGLGLIDDDYACRMDGICTLLIQIFDEMVRELMDVVFH